MELRETCVNKLQGEKTISVYTCELKYMNKLNKLKEQYPSLVQLTPLEDGMSAIVPADWFKFVGPKRSNNLTEEQRQQARDRMANARAKKKEDTLD